MILLVSLELTYAAASAGGSARALAQLGELGQWEQIISSRLGLSHLRANALIISNVFQWSIRIQNTVNCWRVICSWISSQNRVSKSSSDHQRNKSSRGCGGRIKLSLFTDEEIVYSYVKILRNLPKGKKTTTSKTNTLAWQCRRIKGQYPKINCISIH